MDGVEDCWIIFLAEQQIEMDYFKIGSHRGYWTKSGTRIEMNSKELKQNYFYWCEKKLLEYMNKAK